MNRQVTAEKAWVIPYNVKEEMGAFEIDILGSNSLEYYKKLFVSQSLHRFSLIMAETFHSEIHHIQENYDGDASKIREGNPSSATVLYCFLQFKGCGIKNATMASNILANVLFYRHNSDVGQESCWSYTGCMGIPMIAGLSQDAALHEV